MLSRSLGPEFGGSIGIIFIIANIVNGASFILGFADSFAALSSSIPDDRWSLVGYGVAALAILTVISFVGANVFDKTFIVIFASLWVSLLMVFVSFSIREKIPGKYTGWSLETCKSNLFPTYSKDVDFRIALGIFFPAVTGIMAGANLSGDLQSPSKSIPKGTLFAIATTLLTYLFIALIMTCTVENQELKDNYFVMQTLSYNGWVVAQGIFAACLSSALGNILGGSRILQALSRDGMVPIKFFGVGSAKGDEPRRAVVLLACLIGSVALIGELNFILPLVAQFYLLTYGSINIAAFLLSISGAPNFRPRFKYFSIWTSLTGGILHIGLMFVLDPINAALSLIVFLILFALIHFFAPPAAWGDISQALIYHQVRKYLLRLRSTPHVKNWRPSILLFLDHITPNMNLIDFGNNLKKGGVYVLGQVINKEYDPISIKRAKNKIEDFITQNKLKAFGHVIGNPDYRLGAANLIATAGLGGMSPNTVLMPFDGITDGNTSFGVGINVGEHFHVIEDEEETEKIFTLTAREFVGILADAITLEKNIVLARGFQTLNKSIIAGAAKHKSVPTKPKKMTIDLWLTTTSEKLNIELPTLILVIQLGFILHKTDIWRKHTDVRVIGLVENPETRKK